MTIVRIVLADPRTGRVPEGSAVNGQQLIVLADDAGHRAVPLWLRVIDAKLLWGLLERPAGDAVMAGVLEETAARLLHAAGVGVTAVDIEPAGEDVPELRPGTAAARVGLATAAGDRHVTVSAGYGLKLAVVAGAPVRVADAVMDRLAVPVHGEDVHAPFLLPAADRTPGRPGQRRRFEPRNMAFTDGLDYWELAGSFLDAGRPHGRTIPAPPQTSPRSCPPRSQCPPVRPSCSRRSTPRTTAAPRSPSAGSCAPPAWPARPGCIWPQAGPISLPAPCCATAAAAA